MTQMKTLIGGLLVASITSFTAPAQAEVTGEELAAIVVGGALLYSLGKNRGEERARTVVEPAPVARPAPTYYQHSHGRLGLHSHRQDIAHNHGTAAARPLPLPHQCKRTVQVRNKVETGYRTTCLQRAGYRIGNNGTVRHDRWIGRKAKPLLIYR